MVQARCQCRATCIARRFLVCSHFSGYNATHLAINGVVLAVLLIAKLPEMHGVRIAGINKAPTDTE